MPTYYNPTDQPVTIDDAGHVLPGREHADLDGRATQVKAAVERGDLIKSDDAPKAKPTEKE